MPKTIMITGASSGLGEAMARHFAQRGYGVGLTARRTDRLTALAEELNDSPAAAVVVRALDVTDYASVRTVMRQVHDELGHLDIVVANAGIAVRTYCGTNRFDDARRTVETDLLGAMATVDAAVEIFREQGGGQVVGISSVAAVRGLPRAGGLFGGQGRPQPLSRSRAR